MSASLSFDEYGDGIGSGWAVLREHANRAGLDAKVLTCPDWTVRDLVVHQGLVHRWAIATLQGLREVEAERIEAEGRAAVDLLAWLDEGAKRLLHTLASAPDDLEAFFFLKDAAPPKFAWARRQCHEISVHAVDAMSASMQRTPSAAETWLRPALAVDGIDELLCGFVPRRRERLRSVEPLAVHVLAQDTGDSWTMRVSDGPVVTSPGREGSADVVLSGGAVGLYLALWNRGAEIAEDGVPFLEQWQRQVTVAWG